MNENRCEHCGSLKEIGHKCFGDCMAKFDVISNFHGFSAAVSDEPDYPAKHPKWEDQK